MARVIRVAGAQMGPVQRADKRPVIVVDDRISRAGVAIMEGAIVIDPDDPLESPDFVFPLTTSRPAAVLAPPSRYFWRSHVFAIPVAEGASDWPAEVHGKGDPLAGRYVYPTGLGNGPNQ